MNLIKTVARIILIGTPLLASCTVGPEYVRPTPLTAMSAAFRQKLKNVVMSGKEVYPIVEGGKGIGASNGYSARAYDHGTMNITMVSVEMFDNTCSSASNCAAFLGTTYTQNVPAYFVLEASSGGCADVDFLVD